MAKKDKKSREQKKKEKRQRLGDLHLSRCKPDIHKEVAYIIKRAQEHDARLVKYGVLVLFST